MNESNRAYYERNKELVKARALTWSRNNPERRKEIVKKNNEKSREKKRLWHEKKNFGTTVNRQECSNCGHSKDLVVHHVDGNNGKNGKALNNDPVNLSVLCRSCHPTFHNKHWVKPLCQATS